MPQQTRPAIERIAAALERLDKRRHVTPARLEVSRNAGYWNALIMADPLPMPASASAHTPEAALERLADFTDRIDWRRVKR